MNPQPSPENAFRGSKLTPILTRYDWRMSWMSRDIPTTANEEIVLLIGWDNRIGAVQTANNQGFGHFSHCDFPRMEENVT